MISPRPSASARRQLEVDHVVVESSIVSAMRPAGFATGRLTL